MENYIDSLPIKQMLLFLVIGGALYFIFYLITTYAIPVLKKQQYSMGLYLHRIQIISWTVYLLLFFSSMFNANMYLTLFISVIVIGIGWSFWTNFFAGIMIKFTNQFKVNDHISSNLVKGKIKNIKMTFTEVINSKGELLVIPNNQLKNAVLKHLNQKNIINTTTFICNGRFTYDEVYSHALNCPYFTGNQSIKVSRDKSKKYEIKAMLLDESFKEKADAYFEKLD
jgi:hypothetical protein